MASRKELIKILHVLRAKLRIGEDDYRAMLAAYKAQDTGLPAESSTELSDGNLRLLVDALTAEARSAGVWKKRKYRADTLAGRPCDYASPDQIAMLEAMWSDVSRLTTAADREQALDVFIHRRFHRGGVRMIERELVPKIAHALKQMKAQKLRKTRGEQLPC